MLCLGSGADTWFLPESGQNIFLNYSDANEVFLCFIKPMTAVKPYEIYKNMFLGNARDLDNCLQHMRSLWFKVTANEIGVEGREESGSFKKDVASSFPKKSWPKMTHVNPAEYEEDTLATTSHMGLGLNLLITALTWSSLYSLGFCEAASSWNPKITVA